ncbi:Cysteine-rich motor neuron 1 protein like [Argiope bruennichi]|uniref:Cysteine-rich motor neuron 1 protein like n=1 Tax=Argiope bruennichi TaxID=94029 RepID=A0A8T0FUT2_ARGBR|nr:Cysteine-rich motor neuron 1 protein like [Argiope bruennichi]
MMKYHLVTMYFMLTYMLIIKSNDGSQAKTSNSSFIETKNLSCASNGRGRFKRSYFTTHLPLHCPPCEQIHCFKNKRRRLHCKGGWTLGICGCCKVCAKVEGEECGGQHKYLGKCDEGLVCEPQEPRVISFIHNGIKTVYKVEKGICRKGFTQPYEFQDICKPKCSPAFCMKNPRGICSANENGESFQECQGFCQHTSCRACKFVESHQPCATCTKDDFKCIREFGRCIRKEACKAKDYPCGKLKFNWISERKFQCQVPLCQPQ